jgi:hypothetical protein
MRDGYGGEIGHSDARSCILSCPIVAKSVKDPGKNGGAQNCGGTHRGTQLNDDGNQSQRVGHHFVTLDS